MRRLLLIAACLIVFAPKIASAASAGDLVKTSTNPAVYYFGSDGKRYVFPNAAAYFSWYADFSSVKTISPDQLAAMPIGGNVTYRPGTRMVKIQTDPKVYAVAKGGVLRHVGSEAVAVCLYGGNWNMQIDDVPDAFFVDYDAGAPVSDCASYDVGAERVAVPTIGVDKGLDAGITAPLPDVPTFSALPVAVRPAAGQEGTLMELRLRTAPAVRVRQLPVRLDAMLGAPTSGQGADSDLGGLVRGANERLNLTDVRWVDAAGNAVFGSLTPVLDSAKDQGQTFDFAGTWDVPAGSDARLRLVARFDSDIPSGEEFRASLPVSRVAMEDAAGNARSFLPNLDLVAPVVTVGKASFEVSALPIPEEDVQVRGASGVALAAFTFRASSASETRVKSVVFQSYLDEQEGSVGFRAGADADNGTETRVSDLVASVRLTDAGGRVVAGPVPMPFDGRPAFAGLDLAIPAGASADYVLIGDLKREAAIEAHDDRLAFDIADVARDIVVKDPSGAGIVGLGTSPNGGASPLYALTLREHGALAFAWTGVSGTAVAGRETRFGTLEISADHDAFSVSTLTFSSVGASREALTSLRLSYTDAQGVPRSVAQGFTGNDVTFTGLSLRVPRGGIVTATLYGTLKTAVDEDGAGERLRVALAADRPTVFASEAEGRSFTNADLGGAFTLASTASDLAVRLTELSARRSEATPSGTVARGRAVEVLRFRLSAAPEGAVRLKKLAFRLKPSDVGFTGPDSDALERWADVDGDAADDNGVIGLRRYLSSGSEILGEDASAAIRFGIVRAGVLDATPQGLDSAYGDEGRVEIEFLDDLAPILGAGTTSEFALELKTDAFALVSGATLEASLLGGADFVWSDVPQGFYVPLTGAEVDGLPVASPVLTLP